MIRFLAKNRYAVSSSLALATIISIGFTQPKWASLVELNTEANAKDPKAMWIPPPRQELLQKLKENSDSALESNVFDVLIIGGGATGTGCALDAATRGLKTALVERDDFSCGTSSRSTKLVHGGVRYLEKAFLELDWEQYKLVREALHERSVFMKIAPYLAYEMPIMLPIHQWWKVPYYYVGAKAYDLLAGSQGLTSSYYMSKANALEVFPMLKPDNLKGAIVYYDGAHNDSRMNVAIALTAIQHGAVVANHVEVVELLKTPRTTLLGRHGFGKDQLYAARVRDTLTGETWIIKARGIINATGPFCGTKEIVAPSAGVHVILPNYFSPTNMGLLDPSTSDGRVIFFLPWQGGVIAGTTDSPTTVDPNPIPSDNDINWILKEVAGYLSPDIKVRRGDVQAAWSGIRPLVRDPAAKNTAALVRTHMINVSESGLLTIAGGKWTTYRAMAEETIDKAIQVFDLKPLGPSLTLHTPLLGSMNWSKSMFIKLIQHFGLETEVAKHLSDSYGDRAWAVAAVASNTGSRWPIYGTRIASGYPYIEAEIRYACQNEFACTAVDAIARRTRLSFLNAAACLESLPRIIEIMAGELGWDSGRQAKEMKDASDFLLTMGLSIKERLLFPPREEVSTTGETRFLKRTFFTSAEIGDYKMIFTSLNLQNKPDTPAAQLQKAFGRLGTMMSDEEIESIKKHMLEAGSVDFPQFLEILANVKDMRAQDKFARKVAGYKEREQFPTERSGGGV